MTHETKTRKFYNAATNLAGGAGVGSLVAFVIFGHGACDDSVPR